VPLPDTLGKYKILRELGRGAMGVVYRGFDPFIEREVAIKTLRTDAIDGKEKAVLLERFKKEAQAAGRMNHANIVQIYEYGEDADQVFIAMEIVQGVELRDYLEDGSRFSMESIVAMMGELLEALGFAHKHGVVHRDIKPGNIVVLPDGHIKIMDFGIARLESSTLTQAGTVLGTPSYMSPEQFMAQRVDPRSDLFSAGAILYELLTGEKAFPGNAFSTIMHKVLKEEPPPPSELNVLVTPHFDLVVRKALSKRPDARYQNAAEFADALRRALAGESPSPAQRGTSPEVGDATMVANDATIVAGDATMMASALPERTSAAPPSGPAAMNWTEVIPPGVQADQVAQVPQVEQAVSTPAEVVTAGTTTRGPTKMPLLLAGAGVAVAVAIGLFSMSSGVSTPPHPVVATPGQPSAQSPGWIKAESDPTGAVVVVDNGGFGGVTPARLELSAGSHQLKIHKEGFRDWDANVEVEAGQELPLSVSLTPAQ
jgi:serine/threonine-protein kinase